MKKFSLFLFLSIFLMSCNKHQTESSVEKIGNANVYDEVEMKDYYTFKDDLPTIATILGEHEVVMLGEGLHGSLDVNELKTELIEELVDKHDFNNLYMETSKAEMEYFNNNKDKNLIPSDVLPVELLGDSFLSLFEIENLNIVGIDYGPYVTPTLTGNYVLDLIREDLERIDRDLANQFKSFELKLMRWAIGQADDNEPWEENDNLYESIINHEKYLSLEESTRKFIETRDEELKEYYTKTSMLTDTRNAYEMRDAYMAKNIEEDMEKGDKAIVLTHNGHAMSDMKNYESKHEIMKEFFNPPYKTVTNHLRDNGFDVYVVGLFVNEGKYYPESRRGQEVVLEHKEDETTLEGYLGTQINESIFIDYEISDLIPETVTGAYDHGVVEYRAHMKNNQDGIIYIPRIEE